MMNKTPNKVKKPIINNSNNSLKQINEKKRQIFKPILSNPYTRRNDWPHIDPKIQEDIVNILTSQVLFETGRYNRLSKEEKESLGIKNPPTESRFIIHGFNSVMKALEDQIKKKVKLKNTDVSEKDILFLFVCKLDMSSSLLYLHFPVLCSIADVKIVQLPKGTSARLRDVLGIRQSTDVLALERGIVDRYKFLKTVVETNVEDVQPGFLNALEKKKLNMNVQFLLTEQPIIKKK